MHILVTGGSGLVGTKVCAREGKPTYIDLSKPELAHPVQNLDAEIVIHSGGFTDVEGCEAQPEIAERVNGIATGEIGKAARKL
jgi:dTDP-4-dehydrorhamnose reductase